MNGTVKWFDGEKGYGFIGSADGTDIFVHYSAIRADGYRTLDAGKRSNLRLDPAARTWKRRTSALRSDLDKRRRQRAARTAAGTTSATPRPTSEPPPGQECRGNGGPRWHLISCNSDLSQPVRRPACISGESSTCRTGGSY